MGYEVLLQLNFLHARYFEKIHHLKSMSYSHHEHEYNEQYEHLKMRKESGISASAKITNHLFHSAKDKLNVS